MEQEDLLLDPVSVPIALMLFLLICPLHFLGKDEIQE